MSRALPHHRSPLFLYRNLAVAWLSVVAPAVAGQEFPVRPVRMVLGYAAGGTPDVVARTIGERMAEQFGRAVVIDNRPGAAGTIAIETVARATPDGHTLTVSGCSGDQIVYAFVMSERRPLDPFKDFTPVGRLMRDHWLVTVSPALRVNTVQELIALGKAKPGTLNFPSSGTGSSAHLQSERFRKRVGIDAIHVPYKSSAIPDLLAGRMSFAVQSSAAVTPLVQSGKLKALTVLSIARVPALPEVPTSSEVGLPDLVYNAGLCLYAPAGTPTGAVVRVSDALNKASAADSVRQRFADLGVETVQGTPADTVKFIGELMALVDRLRIEVFGKAR